jgi:hypothetical protein
MRPSYIVAFLNASWSVVKGDIMCAFDHFYHREMHVAALQAINMASISLLAKK